jgi:hypothetical protein
MVVADATMAERYVEEELFVYMAALFADVDRVFG